MTHIRFYLANNYNKHPEMRKVRSFLEKRGHTVTSRWINGEHELLEGQDVEISQKFAEDDWQDLASADAVIWFSSDSNTGRGGRHVEFGMALAWNIPILVIGRKENVFHYLSQVKHYESVESAVEELEGQ